MKKPVRSLLCAAVMMAAFAAAPAMAQSGHTHDLRQSASTLTTGANASYTLQFSNHFGDGSKGPKAAADSRIRIVFPADFDLSAANLDAVESIMNDEAGETSAFIAAGSALVGNVATDVDKTGNTITITPLAHDVLGTDHPGGDGSRTVLKIVIDGVKNPAATGTQTVAATFDVWDGVNSVWMDDVPASFAFTFAIPPGIKLGVDPAKVYAKEIIATATAPVTLVNTAGVLNLRLPLSYNFSQGEVRHARLQCDGLVFKAGTAVDYQGSGAGTIGAVNGVGTNAITFSVTAGNNGVVAADYLNVTGDRTITGTSAPVKCTYSLYDFPSQASAGGSDGQVVSKSGDYLKFAASTVFATTGRTSTADVEADLPYAEFVPSAPTTAAVAALARLTYGLPTTVPLKANGTAIALTDLHATGAAGTRIVVAGDFSSAANADGSYTGAALSRVYLSTSNGNCTTLGAAANSLSATQAVFNVGATATDSMLCLAPRTGVAIPVAEYNAVLKAVSAAPAVYAVGELGPEAAGKIDHNGTELQAPLVQIPGGWMVRVVLTNTGSTDRPYSIRALDAANSDDGSAGKALDIAAGKLTGTVPAGGTKVVMLDTDALQANSGNRGTLVVTVAGPSGQIQGLYQIVNPANGLVNNTVLVRPGTN